MQRLCAAAPRPLPRALRDAEPVRAGARGRRPRRRVPHRSRARVGRGRRGGAGSTATRGTSTAGCRRRTAAGRRSSSARTRTRSRRKAPIEPVVEDGVVRNAAGDDPRRPTTRPRSSSMLEAARRIARRGTTARGDRAPLHAAGGGRRCAGADAFDHTRLVATTGFVYDQGGADRRDRPRLAARSAARLPLPRPRPRMPG